MSPTDGESIEEFGTDVYRKGRFSVELGDTVTMAFEASISGSINQSWSDRHWMAGSMAWIPTPRQRSFRIWSGIPKDEDK